MTFPETAIVLVGGMGTRLRKIVPDRPKPLAWVAGQPFLARLLDQLNLLGLRRVVLAAGYKAEAIRDTFGERYRDLDLIYSVETHPLGTGGALLQAVPKIPDAETEILALNGDSYCAFDGERLLAAHTMQQNRITLVLHLTENVQRYGIPSVDPSGKIRDFAEKPTEFQVKNAGIYLLDVSLLRETELNGPLSLERDLLPAWTRQGWVGSVTEQGRFIDIGMPASWWEAQEFFSSSRVPQFSNAEEILKWNTLCADMFRPRNVQDLNRWKLAVGAILRNPQGQILLEERTDCGLWGLPGGRMDFGESIEATLRREVREECGLEIHLERLVGIYSDPHGRIISYPDGDVVQCVTAVLECSVAGGVLTPSEECHSLRFFSPKDLPREVIPQAQDAILDCLSGKSPQVR